MLRAIPKSLKSQATFSIKQGTIFRHSCASYFYVEQGKLTYCLSKDSPTWLSVNARTGIIWGKAPSVYTAKTYPVKVIAKNVAGSAEWLFYLTVTRDGFAHAVDAVIQQYIDRKHKRELEEAYRPELLEYIYAYLEQSDNPDAFFAQLKEAAAKLGVAVDEKPTYKDFAKIVKIMMPDAQAILTAELPATSPLTNAQVSVFDLQNLFRQGSQPSGALAGPVFNYFAAPTRHIWSAQVKNILNTAVISVIEQQQRQQRQVDPVPERDRQRVTQPTTHKPS